MKKRIVFLLVCLMAAQALASCGEDTPAAADTTAAPVETTEAAPTYNLPAKENNGGRTFTILGAGKRSERYDAEQTGDVVDDAVYKRNMLTEEHLGIDIEVVEKDSGWQVANQYSAEITSVVLAGDDTYDLVTGAMTVIPKLAMTGNFVNVLELDIDLTNPWWISDLEETAAVNGKLYSLVGDLSLTVYRTAAVIFSNNRLQAEYKLGNFYDLVREGKWTVDAMLSASKDITRDLNGDGEIVREDDQIAWMGHFTPFCSLQVSTQIDLLQHEGDSLAFVGLDERLVTLYEKFMSAVTDGTLMMKNAEGYDIWAVPFMEDRNLFQISTLNSTTYFRDMESDFAILPLPKFDEAQEDYILDVSQSTVLWAVPVTASDYELTAKFCEVFAHYSKEHMIPAYYETTLQEKFSRDADTAEMLEIIRSGIRLTLDGYLSYCFSPTPITTTAKIVESDQAPASYIAANEAAWQTQLEAIAEAYTD
ncbi:MAG: hypothetical protein IJF67_11860 [Clostridia bacterium]|nr:hypothetical protein [Clostridia bacterium]